MDVTARARQRFGVLFTVSALATTLLGASGGGCGSGDRAAPGSSSEPTRDGAGGAPAADGAGATACPPVIPPGARDGGRGLPCQRPDCDLVVTSDPTSADPALPWAACGVGCFELFPDGGGPGYALFDARGAARNGVRYLATTRNLADDSLEIQIVRLPENRIVFEAWMPDGFHSTCSMRLDALSPDGALAYAWDFDDATQTDLDPRMYVVPLGGAAPGPPQPLADLSIPIEAVITAELWAATFGHWDLTWHDAGPGGSPGLAWPYPGGPEIAGLAAAGETVFFGMSGPVGLHQLVAWDPVEGARPLRGTTSVDGPAAGCPATDGVDLVWLEGDGLDPAQDTFASMRLMTSPFATHAADLTPHALRPVTHDNLLGAWWAVGGGHAALLETRVGTEQTLTVTRLSDGAFWTLPPRPSRHWGEPLYVDAEELAVVEYLPAGGPTDTALPSLASWNIVRLELASLGPPTMP